MARATLDPRTSSTASRGDKGQPGKKKKKKGSGVALGLLLYGAACAVGGAYVDRNLLPQARVWLGSQAQTLGEMGMEQKIRGYVDQADLSPSDKQKALASVQRVYAARAAGRLSTRQVEDLIRAEAPIQAAAATKATLLPEQLQSSLDLFAGIASDL